MPEMTINIEAAERGLKRIWDDPEFDYEKAHREADELIYPILETLGLLDIIEQHRKIQGRFAK